MSYLYEYNNIPGSEEEAKSHIIMIPDTTTYLIRQEVMGNSNIVCPVYGCDVKIAGKTLDVISTGKSYGYTQYDFSATNAPPRKMCVLIIPYVVKIKSDKYVGNTSEFTKITDTIFPSTIILIVFGGKRKNFNVVKEGYEFNMLDEIPCKINPNGGIVDK